MYPMVTIMGNYRSTDAYREADIRDPIKKLGTLSQGLEQWSAKEEDTGSRYAETGNAFLGTIDYMIYEMTPVTIPHEGFERLDGAVWIFWPTMFSQTAERPVVHDDIQIAEQYLGYSLGGTGMTLSFSAELYRRWGWLGLPIGLFAYGVLYGLVFRKIHQHYLFRNALWGFILCGLSFMMWTFGPILSTLSVWFYDIPKHLLILGGLYFCLKLLISPKPVPGALALGGGSSRNFPITTG